jgi:hypothetical protein
MVATVLTDAILWANDYNLTTATHQIQLDASVKEQDVTTFGGNGYMARIAGLKDVTAEVHGYWDAPPDASIYNSIGTFDIPVTIAPTSTEGSTAYMFLAARTKYAMFGKVGDAIPFNYSSVASNTVGLVRGLIVDAPGNITTTGVTGSPQQVGAGGTGKWIYATYHVFVAGTTMTIQVQSAPTVGGTYTTRATFPAFTATGGYWLTRVSAAGITDPWWRFNVAPGITGTFNGSGAVAVQ